MSAGADRELVWRLDPSGLRAATLQPPASKSDVQRALVLQHIIGRPDWVTLPEPLAAMPADVQAMARGLAALASADLGPVDIDCADGGAPFRILVGQAAATPGVRVRFFGTLRLAERPHGPLLQALLSSMGPAGLEVRSGNPWPLEVYAPKARAVPRFSISGAESSQFVTSLLLAAAALHKREERPWTVELTGPTASAGYLELTLRWMARAGFAVERTESSFSVTGWSEPSGTARVPGDWSSIGYLLLLAWRSRGSVTDVDIEADHPDRAALRILGDAGLSFSRGAAGELRVEGTLRAGLTASGAECPDLLPTLAAAACLAPAPSRLLEVEILRGKESDRLAGIIELVQIFGGRTELLPGGVLEIHPPPQFPRQAQFDSRGDHRLALSAATLSALSGASLALRQPTCVAKSFPGFWHQAEAAGIRIQRP